MNNTAVIVTREGNTPDPILDNLTRVAFINARDAAKAHFGELPHFMLMDRRTSLQFINYERTFVEDDQDTEAKKKEAKIFGDDGVNDFVIGGVYAIATIRATHRFLKFTAPGISNDLFDAREYLNQNPDKR